MKNTTELDSAQANPAQPNYIKKLAQTFFSVVSVYHARVSLNESVSVKGTSGAYTGYRGHLTQTYSGIIQTVSQANRFIAGSKPLIPYTFFSWPFYLNTTRGTLAIYSSAAGRDLANSHISPDNRYQKPISNFVGAVLGGAAALLVETPFLRLQKGLSPFYFSFRLARWPLPLGREISFVTTVLGQENNSPAKNFVSLFPGAYLTGAFHRYYAYDVTKEARPAGSYPNWSNGFTQTISDIAHGRINDETFQNIPFKEPKSRLQLAANFFAASCTLNTFIFRLNYLLQLSVMLWGYNQLTESLKKLDQPESPSSTATISECYKTLIQQTMFKEVRSVSGKADEITAKAETTLPTEEIEHPRQGAFRSS